MMVDDNPNDTAIRKSAYKNWNRSLCRNVTMSILEFLKKIETHEVHNSGPNNSSSVSKQSFYSQLSQTMSTFRRNEADDSSAIIWIAQKSRRFGYQFEGQSWKCKAAVLSISGGLIPRAVITPAAGHRRAREDTNPQECLENSNNGFIEKITHGKISPISVIALRGMIFRKRHFERLHRTIYQQRKVFIKNWKENYQLTPNTHLKDFFFSDSAYQSCLQNTFYRSGAELNPRLPLTSKGVKESGLVLAKALENQANWAIVGGRIYSMLCYDMDGVSDKIENLHYMIEDREDYVLVSKYAVTHGIYTDLFIDYMKECFDCYKEIMMEHYREDPERARNLYGKKRNRNQGRD